MTSRRRPHCDTVSAGLATRLQLRRDCLWWYDNPDTPFAPAPPRWQYLLRDEVPFFNSICTSSTRLNTGPGIRQPVEDFLRILSTVSALIDYGPRKIRAGTQAEPMKDLGQLGLVHEALRPPEECSTVLRVPMRAYATYASDPMTHTRRQGEPRPAASHLNSCLRRIAWRNVKHGHCRARPPEGHLFSAFPLSSRCRTAVAATLPSERGRIFSGSPDLGPFELAA